MAEERAPRWPTVPLHIGLAADLRLGLFIYVFFFRFVRLFRPRFCFFVSGRILFRKTFYLRRVNFPFPLSVVCIRDSVSARCIMSVRARLSRIFPSRSIAFPGKLFASFCYTNTYFALPFCRSKPASINDVVFFHSSFARLFFSFTYFIIYFSFSMRSRFPGYCKCEPSHADFTLLIKFGAILFRFVFHIRRACLLYFFRRYFKNCNLISLLLFFSFLYFVSLCYLFSRRLSHKHILSNTFCFRWNYPIFSNRNVPILFSFFNHIYVCYL